MSERAKRFMVKLDWERPRCWRDDAVNIDKFDEWDSAWRKRLGWRAGLKFFGKTNVPTRWVLVSRHWPHLLCWSWCLTVNTWRKGYDGPRMFRFLVNRKYRFAELNLFGPGVYLSWQDYGHMAALGPTRNAAPKIIWRHHLKNADVAGSA